MMSNDALNKLFVLFKKYIPNSKPDADSQMCLLWSTKNPPDVLENTKQLEAIETIYGIDISEDEAVKMYDMSLLEVSKYIKELVEIQQ